MILSCAKVFMQFLPGIFYLTLWPEFKDRQINGEIYVRKN